MATFRMVPLVALAVVAVILSASAGWAGACTQSLSVDIAVSEAAQCAYVFSLAEQEDGSCPSLQEAMQQWLAQHSLTTTPPPQDDGAIAHYAFDENLSDSTANHRDGELGMSGQITYGSGQCGKAAVFNGGSSVVVDAFRNYPWGSQFSVSVWFRRTGGVSNYQGIVNTGYYTTGSWEVRMGRELNGQMLGGGVVTADSAVTWNYINIEASLGDWHHAVMTYDGSELLFYLDNQAQGGDRFCCHGDIISRDTPVTIGQAGVGGSGEFFVGLIDEVKIFDKALSADDVNRLFNSPCA